MQDAAQSSSSQVYALNNIHSHLPKRLLPEIVSFNELVEEFLLNDAVSHLPKYVTEVITDTKTLITLRAEKILVKDNRSFFHQACINFMCKSTCDTLLFIDLYVIGDSMRPNFPNKNPAFARKYLIMLEAIAPYCDRSLQIGLYELSARVSYLLGYPIYSHHSKHYYTLAPLDELLKNFSPLVPLTGEEENNWTPGKVHIPLDWESLFAASEPVPPKK
jgi:hypothetical protein